MVSWFQIHKYLVVCMASIFLLCASCSKVSAGTSLYCWGNNNVRQLGIV
jgi:hypothetical protein